MCDGGTPDLCDTEFASITITAANDAPTVTLTCPSSVGEPEAIGCSVAYDDPESNYLDPLVWARLNAATRVLMRAHNTLLGRMGLGPPLGTLVFWRAEIGGLARREPGVARAWVLHLAGVALIGSWLAAVAQVPAWQYLAACWLGLSLLRIRTFAEHRAHERHGARSVIIEDRGPLSLLFLNNNFHAVHHAHPKLPWYRLPGEYERRREVFLKRNDGYRYGSYRELFVRHLFRRKDPVPHPLRTGHRA